MNEFHRQRLEKLRQKLTNNSGAIEPLYLAYLNVDAIPRDRLEDGQFISLNVQAEVVDRGAIERGQDGIDGKTLNLNVAGLILVVHLILRYPALVEVLLKHNSPERKTRK